MSDPRVSLVEDEGINPESKVAESDDYLKNSNDYQDPFKVILESMANIKTMIDLGNMDVARSGIKAVRTIISMGIQIAEARRDMALKEKLGNYKPLLDELEAKINIPPTP